MVCLSPSCGRPLINDTAKGRQYNANGSGNRVKAGIFKDTPERTLRTLLRIALKSLPFESLVAKKAHMIGYYYTFFRSCSL